MHDSGLTSSPSGSGSVARACGSCGFRSRGVAACSSGPGGQRQARRRWWGRWEWAHWGRRARTGWRQRRRSAGDRKAVAARHTRRDGEERAGEVDRGAAAWRCTGLSPSPQGLRCSDDTPAHSTCGTEGAHAKGGSRPTAVQGPHRVRHGKSRMGGLHAYRRGVARSCAFPPPP